MKKSNAEIVIQRKANMQTKTHWAVVNNPGDGIAVDGPAYGIGASPDAAKRDARRWLAGASLRGTKTIRITQESFRAVKAGNPDAWEAA